MKEKVASPGHREKIQQDLQSLMKDTRELLRSTAENVGGQTQELRDRLEQRLNTLQHGVSQTAQMAGERFKEGFDATDEVVRQYPWQAMGVSLLAGFLLGMMLRRR